MVIVTYHARGIDSYSARRDERADLWLLKKGDGCTVEPKPINKWFESEEYEKVKHEESEEYKFRNWRKTHLIHFQDALIDRYIAEGFRIIALLKKTKRPLDKGWNTKPEAWLRGLDAKKWTLGGNNLAAIAGKGSHGLHVIDIDTKDVPEKLQPFLDKTLTANTYRGFHMYFKTGKDEIYDSDVFRGMVRRKVGRYADYAHTFVVLPLSTRENGFTYTFVDWTRPIMRLTELLKVL
jgi:hypothetical protein